MGVMTGNILSPALSLPPEILAEIVGEVALDTHAAYVESVKGDASFIGAEVPGPYSWIRLSHVCHVWRSVAVSTPSLWANICIIDASATKEFLRRSASRRLTVTFKRNPLSVEHLSKEEREARMTTFRSIVLGHIQRITSLTVPTCFAILTPDIAEAATQLRSITMFSHHFDIGPRGRSPLPLPFPVLEHLEFRVAALRPRYHPVLCTTLKSLILQPDPTSFGFGQAFSSHLPTARELVRIIATMPRLENLDVRLSPIPESITQTAELPHLHRIRLVGAPVAVISSMLAHVIPACNGQLNIDCRLGDEVNEGIFLSVPRIIARALGNAVDPSLFAPCVAFSIGDIRSYYGLYGWRRDPNFAACTDFAALGADADVRVTCAWKETYEDLSTILRPFTLCAVQHVRIGKMPWHIPGMLENTSTLCSHKGLRSLTLDGVVVTRALYLLADTSASDITLLNINFKPSNPEKEAQWLYNRPATLISSDEPSFVADLVEVLEERAVEGKPVVTLRILCARNMVASDVEALRERVVELQWDGLQVDAVDSGE